MANSNLYVVGTVHTDLDGRERLGTLFDKLSPSIVALEFHKERENIRLQRKSIEEMEKEMERALDDSKLDLSSEQRAVLMESGNLMNKTMGYEFKASKDYTENNPNSRLEYIDSSIFKNGPEKFLEGYNEMMVKTFQQIAENSMIKEMLLESLDRGLHNYVEDLRTGTQQTYQSVEEMAEFIEMLRSPEALEEARRTMPPQAVQALEQMINPERDKAMGTKVRELYDGTGKVVAVVGMAHLHGLESEIRDLNPRIITLAEYNSI
jgi:pheromone shutdown protein TraB